MPGEKIVMGHVELRSDPIPIEPKPQPSVITPEQWSDLRHCREQETLRMGHEMAKIGHAVIFLNNYLPIYGSRPFTGGGSGDEGWKEGEEPEKMMEDVPKPIQEDLQRTIRAALGFLERKFQDIPREEKSRFLSMAQSVEDAQYGLSPVKR